jgi:hypothetical protein
MNKSQFYKSEVLKLCQQGNTHVFDQLALSIFHWQATHNPVYQQYLQYLGTDLSVIDTVRKIPFLPIEFFKTHTVVTDHATPNVLFESSGTMGQVNSKHWVADPNFYLQLSQLIFEQFYGQLSDFHVFALLPSYLERNNSSLVYMADHFIKQSHSTLSGFFLHDLQALRNALQMAIKDNRKILLLGVTFALLDWAEDAQNIDFLKEFDQLIVMETGGMKGRRKEMLREEIHDILTKAFHVSVIHSEYGMTELLSQGYSKGLGIFMLPPTMKILLREVMA